MPLKQPERLALGRLCTRQERHVFTVWKLSETAHAAEGGPPKVGDAGKSMVLVLRGSLVVKKKARRRSCILTAACCSVKPFLKRAYSCLCAPRGRSCCSLAVPCLGVLEDLRLLVLGSLQHCTCGRRMMCVSRSYLVA